MIERPRRACAIALLCSLAMPGWAAAQPGADADATPAQEQALAARIARVEQGLSSRIVVKGAAVEHHSLAERMAAHGVPAVSIALVNDGQVEWTRAYGLADVASGQRATTRTLFQAGSISKPLAAMGALGLVESGRLTLDGPANAVLHDWRIPENTWTRDTPVSLRMLLNHSAGATVHGYLGYLPGQPLPTLAQVLDGVAPATSDPVRIDTAPGTVWRYSGGGYSIVQAMMDDASGRPFAGYMRTQVLDRLGMTRSTFQVPLPPALQASAATGYGGADGATAHRNLYPESAAAGLWSTAAELAQVVIEVQQAEAGAADRLLSPAMAGTLLTRGLGDYGLGFFVQDLGEVTSFSHSGGSEGFRAQLYGYTRSGQGVVVMTNSNGGAALIDELLVSIAAEYGWPEFQRVEKPAIAGDAGLNRAVAGRYRLLDTPALITAEGHRLYFQSALFGNARMEMFRASEQVFFMTAQDMSVRFTRDADGAVGGFDLLRGAGTYTATRTP